MSDLLFGDTLEYTVVALVDEAVLKNTAEAWRRAADQLSGISFLVTTIRVKAGPRGALVHTAIALDNTIGRCERLAASPEDRARLAEMRETHD